MPKIQNCGSFRSQDNAEMAVYQSLWFCLEQVVAVGEVLKTAKDLSRFSKSREEGTKLMKEESFK